MQQSIKFNSSGWDRNVKAYFSLWDRKAAPNPYSMVTFIVHVLDRHLMEH